MDGPSAPATWGACEAVERSVIPFFVVEFRPVRYLLLVLTFGILQGAAHGYWQAWVILSAGAVLLWWHLLLDAARQLWEAADEACMFVAWA